MIKITLALLTVALLITQGSSAKDGISYSSTDSINIPAKYLRAAAAAASSSASQDEGSNYFAQRAENATTFNNVDYVELGYDIFSGFPLPSQGGIDPGFKTTRIFNLLTTNDTTLDGRYIIPKGLSIVNELSCSLSFHSEQISSESNLMQQIDKQVEIDTEMKTGSFRTSDEYHSLSSTTNKTGSQYFITTGECQTYRVWVDNNAHLELSESFVRDVKLYLSDPTNQADYVKFLSYYGTHYMASMTMGARLSIIKTVNQTSLQTMQQSGFNAKSAASSSAQMSYSNQQMYGSQVNEASTFESMVSDTRVSTIGSRPPLDGDANSWAQQSFENPMPLTYKLRSIVNLFDSKFMNEQALFQGRTDFASIKQALDNAMDAYCVEIATDPTVCTTKATSEFLCPGGFTAGLADGVCSPCPANHFCPPAAKKTQCPTNSFSAKGSDRFEACKCTPNAKFDEKTYSCSCKPGYYSADEASPCRPCPLRGYCPGGTEIEVCPVSVLTSTPLASTIEDCVCPANNSLVQKNSSYECLCLPGYYSTTAPGDGNPCALCLKGSYCPGERASKQSCPAKSSTLNNLLAKSIDDCLCDAGFYWVNTTQECRTCPTFASCPGKQPHGADLINCNSTTSLNKLFDVTSKNCTNACNANQTLVTAVGGTLLCIDNNFTVKLNYYEVSVNASSIFPSNTTTYTWNFGDGSASVTGAQANYSYWAAQKTGFRNITLTVKSDQVTFNATRTIYVQIPDACYVTTLDENPLNAQQERRTTTLNPVWPTMSRAASLMHADFTGSCRCILRRYQYTFGGNSVDQLMLPGQSIDSTDRGLRSYDIKCEGFLIQPRNGP